tara:strand:- start:7060 stop:7227 length:168 start_codon:yes stop_codon:yes gene_type:complete
MSNLLDKFRPQIFVVMVLLGVLAFVSLLQHSIEITTGCITLMGALGMKILEKDNG